MRVGLREEAFQNDPFNLPKKLGGHELPIDQLDYEFEFHPEYKKWGEGAISYPEYGGMLVCYKVYRFPKKGFPTSPAVESIGIIKKLLLNSLILLTSSPFRYLLAPIVILPRKTRERAFYLALKLFVEISDWSFNRWYLKPDRMCPCMREIYLKTESWIIANYSSSERSNLLIRALLIGCMIFEYDSAYRERLQDILMELDKEKLRDNPSQELKRLFKIFSGRETIDGVPPDKYKPFVRVLRLMVKLKKKIADRIVGIICLWDLSGVTWEELEKIDFTNPPLVGIKQRVGRDHGDWYFCLASPSFSYGGRPFYERLALKKKIDIIWYDQLVKAGIIK